MKKEPDLYYEVKGLFVGFVPNTEDGLKAWKDMAIIEPTCTFLATHKAHIFRQLRDAGYTYAKMRIIKTISAKQAKALMNELESLRGE